MCVCVFQDACSAFPLKASAARWAPPYFATTAFLIWLTFNERCWREESADKTTEGGPATWGGRTWRQRGRSAVASSAARLHQRSMRGTFSLHNFEWKARSKDWCESADDGRHAARPRPQTRVGAPLSEQWERNALWSWGERLQEARRSAWAPPLLGAAVQQSPQCFCYMLSSMFYESWDIDLEAVYICVEKGIRLLLMFRTMLHFDLTEKMGIIKLDMQTVLE